MHLLPNQVIQENEYFDLAFSVNSTTSTVMAAEPLENSTNNTQNPKPKAPILNPNKPESPKPWRDTCRAFLGGVASGKMGKGCEIFGGAQVYLVYWI